MATELEDAAEALADDGGPEVPDVHLFRDVRATPWFGERKEWIGVNALSVCFRTFTLSNKKLLEKKACEMTRRRVGSA